MRSFMALLAALFTIWAFFLATMFFVVSAAFQGYNYEHGFSLNLWSGVEIVVALLLAMFAFPASQKVGELIDPESR
jgi:hypothetical protein